MKGTSKGEDDGVKEEETLRWGKKVGMGQVAIEESPESRGLGGDQREGDGKMG